jgi:hypothetical protein
MAKTGWLEAAGAVAVRAEHAAVAVTEQPSGPPQRAWQPTLTVTRAAAPRTRIDLVSYRHDRSWPCRRKPLGLVATSTTQKCG